MNALFVSKNLLIKCFPFITRMSLRKRDATKGCDSLPRMRLPDYVQKAYQALWVDWNNCLNNHQFQNKCNNLIVCVCVCSFFYSDCVRCSLTISTAHIWLDTNLNYGYTKITFGRIIEELNKIVKRNIICGVVFYLLKKKIKCFEIVNMKCKFKSFKMSNCWFDQHTQLNWISTWGFLPSNGIHAELLPCQKASWTANIPLMSGINLR